MTRIVQRSNISMSINNSFLAKVRVGQGFQTKIDSNSIESTPPTGGFLQTAVSDAPPTTSRTYLRSGNGAHPIQH